MSAPLYPRKHPCLCGSGKKYKNCCEGSVVIDERKLRAAEVANPGTIAAMADAIDAELVRRKESP